MYLRYRVIFRVLGAARAIGRGNDGTRTRIGKKQRASGSLVRVIRCTVYSCPAEDQWQRYKLQSSYY